MITRKAIEKRLFEARIPTNFKGFVYLVDALEIKTLAGNLDICITKDIYPVIAKKHKTTHIAVERDIRNAINRSYEGDHDNGCWYGLSNKAFIWALSFMMSFDDTYRDDTVETCCKDCNIGLYNHYSDTVYCVIDDEHHEATHVCRLKEGR